MALIFFLLSSFGIAFALRIFEVFRSRSLLSTNFLAKIGTIFIFSSSLIVIFLFSQPKIAACLLILNVLITISIVFLCECRQIDAFRAQLPHFLDSWILDLKLGNSLSSARTSALATQESRFRQLMAPIFENSVPPEAFHSHSFLSEAVFSELRALITQPHAALERLENLREHIRKTDDFRRRSGQAILQTRIQSLTLSVLQFALTLFTIRRFGWKNSGDLILLSSFLSILGLVALSAITRKRKWKI